MTTERADRRRRRTAEGRLWLLWSGCTNHNFEIADRLCGDCGRPFCHALPRHPVPAAEPPLCHSCAVAAAGIRKGAQTAPVRSRREIKAFEKERRQAEARPEPATPGDAGFGPAKPAFTSGPSRPVTRADASKRAAAEGEDDEQEQGDKPGDEERAGSAKNRPLWGLAR